MESQKWVKKKKRNQQWLERFEKQQIEPRNKEENNWN